MNIRTIRRIGKHRKLNFPGIALFCGKIGNGIIYGKMVRLIFADSRLTEFEKNVGRVADCLDLINDVARRITTSDILDSRAG